MLADWPVERWQGRRLVVGVSGGADSVALLLALHELASPDQLVVAHLNHGWRGLESDGDAAFVVKLCAELNRECVTGLLRERDSLALRQFDDVGSRDVAMLAKGNVRVSGGGFGANVIEDAAQVNAIENETWPQQTEEKARLARYEFFKETAYKYGAGYVVTAHTADDRIETLLHNMLRGAGLAGTTSLVMFRAFDEDLVLARPLLRKRRSDIERFLKARGQDYRQDSSNLSTHYRRNFLRQDVLPLVCQRYTAAADSLLNFSELAEELLADLQKLADQWLERIGCSFQIHESASTFAAPQAAISDTPWSIVHAALRRVWCEHGWPLADMSRAHWQALRELSGRSAGVINLPGNLRAELRDGRLMVSAPAACATKPSNFCPIPNLTKD